MSAASVICPQCGAETSITLTSGDAYCAACQHEWNPADVPAPAPNADDVLGPPEAELAARDAQARLDALIDTDVMLEGGQVATIVSFPDDDHVTVLLRYDDDHDELATVAFGDVVRAVQPRPVALDVSDDDAYKLAAVNMLVVGLAINAAIATLEGDAPDYRLRTPPAGWLPDDASSLPIIEQGVAYAIATLAVTYGIPRAALATVAEQFVSDAQDPTMKGATP